VLSIGAVHPKRNPKARISKSTEFCLGVRFIVILGASLLLDFTRFVHDILARLSLITLSISK
jgi:hypothetical protein